MKKFALSVVIFLIFSQIIFSQTKIAYHGDSSYTLVERTNLRRYVNGKYSGLTSREVRSFISRTFAPGGIPSAKSDRWYDGNFFVVEETLRNSKATMAGIHQAIPSVFKISADGKMTMFQDKGYPTFRSFPSYTTEHLKPGDSWKGEGERAVDPLNKGLFTRIPILVLYTFDGEEVYKGENVYRIKAIWQTNYGFSNPNRDPKGDDTLKKAMGGHKADIIVRAATGEAILINDNVDENFTYSDGTQVSLKGTITMFTEYPPAVDRDKLIFALNRIAKADSSVKSSGSVGKNDSSLASKASLSSGGNPSAAGKNSGEGLASSGITGKNSGERLASAGTSGKNSGERLASSGITGKNSGEGLASSGISDKNSGKSSVTSPWTDKNSGKTGQSLSDDLGIGSSIASSKGNSNSDYRKGMSDNISGSGKKSSGGISLNEKYRQISNPYDDRKSSSKDSDESLAEGENSMVFEETPAGIRLSVRDIKFKADSDEVLGSEKGRLDEIAEVLKLAPDSQFLIEGHTASVGKPAGEQKLSEERASRIANELSKRGIPADKFICKGHGGNKPIAPNSSDSGRAKNRRVEITILE